MNILLTNYMETTSVGGINQVVSQLGRGLSKKGHNVIVLQGNPLKLASEEIYESFRIIRIRSPLETRLWDFNVKMFFYLRKHLSELDPQVIHLHGHHLSSPEIIYTIKKLGLEIPIVATYHIDTFSGEMGRKYLWGVYTHFGKYVAKKATHITADSDFEAEYVRKTFNVRDDKLSIMQLGVDPVFQNSSPKSKKSFRQEAVNLLFVGHLIKRKNVAAILRTLCELVYRYEIQDACLTIVGKGPEMRKLMDLADELGITRHINWKESLSKEALVAEFSKADVFLLLSVSEAYGIAVAEALSAGTPCVITDTTGLSEFAKEPGCFAVEHPPDPQKVANLILEIRKNKVTVGPFSNKIRTWEEVVRDYEALYQTVLKAEKP